MARTGIKPPAPDASKAKCCECNANYGDGRRDCEHRDCPIYCRMPYRKLEPDYMWVFGKWTTVHRVRQQAMGLSKEQYITTHIKRPNGKNTLGINALFRAKCFRCTGNFYDGRIDQCSLTCPIYYWMPYRKNLPDLNWLFDLSYTKRHEQKRRFERLTREEYIAKYIAKGDVEIEEEKESHVVRVRRLA